MSGLRCELHWPKRWLHTRSTLLILIKNTRSPSVISDHCIKFNHNFEWKDVKILDTEPYNKRLISEMVHVKKQSQGLNKQTDTESLSDSYFFILQSLSF